MKVGKKVSFSIVIFSELQSRAMFSHREDSEGSQYGYHQEKSKKQIESLLTYTLVCEK